MGFGGILAFSRIFYRQEEKQVIFYRQKLPPDTNMPSLSLLPEEHDETRQEPCPAEGMKSSAGPHAPDGHGAC